MRWLDWKNQKEPSVYNIGQANMLALHPTGRASNRKDYCQLSSISKNLDLPFGTLSETASENHSSILSSEMVEYSDVLDIEALSTEVKLDHKKQKLGPLDPVHNLALIDDLAPFLGPTFNLAVYVNNSSTLQELVKLGVNLSKLEKDSYKARYVLSLKFEEDVKPFLLFLHSLQVPPEQWGWILTTNPFLMKEDQDVLATRVEYLKSKNFSIEMIVDIVTSCPLWLSQSIVTVDSGLGFLQRQFSLTGDDVRTVATKLPQLVFTKQMNIVEKHFILHEEFGFTKNQLRELVVCIPELFRKKSDVKSNLLMITKKMTLSLEAVMQFPGLLTSEGFILDNRHFFLKSLGRAQYDPTKANFICPETFAKVSDTEFAVEMARSSVCAYHAFLKTL